ncbi:metal-sensing transcriptional repressor [Butyrivibrio fibrisolvens]|uniref:metal-sensing transcriptional repressor n=1 Tax=Butyrivibrio fibrisolvens TaxID=831 RepID=UPI0026B51D8B
MEGKKCPHCEGLSDEQEKIIEAEAASVKSCCMSGKSKERAQKEYKDLINRLSRIEGQIRGIRGMIENDAYCVDVLTQVQAARSSLNSFSKVLLANHVKTCVKDDVMKGSDEKLVELIDLLQKMI